MNCPMNCPMKRLFVSGHGSSGDFVLTDIQMETPDGWRMAERHSSRQEKALAP
jgi:hypothetical protein